MLDRFLRGMQRLRLHTYGHIAPISLLYACRYAGVILRLLYSSVYVEYARHFVPAIGRYFTRTLYLYVCRRYVRPPLRPHILLIHRLRDVRVDKALCPRLTHVLGPALPALAMEAKTRKS